MARLITLILLLLGAIHSAGAGSGTLTVSPASQTVNPGDTLTVKVVQNSGVVTSGSQATVNFDPTLLQLTSVALGAPYSGASLLMGTGVQTPAQAIAAANSTGHLVNVAAYFAPGAGSVPAGQAEFLVITMHAGAAGGASPITLTGTEMLDAGGIPLTVTATNGQVTVSGGATPTAMPTNTATSLPPTNTPTRTHTPTTVPASTQTVTPTPTPTGAMSSATATHTATATGAAVTGTPPAATPTGTAVPPSATATQVQPSPTQGAVSSPTAAATATRTRTATATIPPESPTATPAASLAVSPPSMTVPPGSQFSLTVVQRTSTATTGAQTNVTFNPALLQVVSVDKGRPYLRASIIYGEVLPNGDQRTGPVAITDANATGVLKNVAAFLIPGSGSVGAGENPFVSIKFQAKSQDGTSSIGLSNMSLLDEAGDSLNATATNGEVIVKTGAPVPTSNVRGITSLPRSGAGGDSGVNVWWTLALVAGLGGCALASLLVARRALR